MEEILVSIWCITYNHELYIRDAIEGFLAQKTNFRYEIIIHDDFSTDNTVNIIKEYALKYPERIQGVYQKENQHSKNPFSTRWIQTIQKQKCRGKYIALCEGDDYWIDPYKLQMQIDYMETHPECTLTVHNAIDINYLNGEVKARNPFEKGGILTAEEVILQSRGHLPTASMVYRNEVRKMDGFFLDIGIEDYPTALYYMNKGKVYYFDRIMSVYRCFHKGSYGDGLLREKKKFFLHTLSLISFLDQYNQYTDKVYEKFIVNRVQEFADDIIYSNIREATNNFKKICEQYDKETEYKYHIYIEEIIRIYLLIFDNSPQNVDDCIRQAKGKEDNIYIMGAGKYASIIAGKLDYFHIKYQGFIVSNNQEHLMKYLNKPVWKMKDILSELRKSVVIIGINPRIWSQIIEELERSNIENYICPFRVKI